MMDIRSGIPALLFCKLAQVAKKTVPGEDLRPLHRRAPQEKKSQSRCCCCQTPRQSRCSVRTLGSIQWGNSAGFLIRSDGHKSCLMGWVWRQSGRRIQIKILDSTLGPVSRVFSLSPIFQKCLFRPRPFLAKKYINLAC